MNIVPLVLMVMLDDMPIAAKMVAAIIVGLGCFFVGIFGLGKVAAGFDKRPPDWGKVIMGAIQVCIAIMVAIWVLLP